jgi:HSP20 family protein
MSLVRWNPTRDLLPTFPSDMLNIQREINRMFDSCFRGGVQEPSELLTSTWSPSVDITEKDDGYIVKVELPGVGKDDVKITMQDNVLTIGGEKKQEKESKESNFHRIERSYGRFQRSFSLPSAVKSDKIEAEYKDGILRVVLPKSEASRPKQIDVKVK